MRKLAVMGMTALWLCIGVVQSGEKREGNKTADEIITFWAKKPGKRVNGKLVSVDLSSVPYVQHSLVPHLAKLTDLQHLELANTDITDEGLKQLQHLKNLQTLDLRLTKIKRAALAHLRNFPKLEELLLAGTKITDADLRHLKELKQLNRLTLLMSDILGSGLKHVPKNLKSLSLGESRRFTDSNVTHISRFTNLEELYLR